MKNAFDLTLIAAAIEIPWYVLLTLALGLAMGCIVLLWRIGKNSIRVDFSRTESGGMHLVISTRAPMVKTHPVSTTNPAIDAGPEAADKTSLPPTPSNVCPR